MIVYFCGTTVSDIPIAASEEKNVMEMWYWDYETDNLRRKLFERLERMEGWE